MNLTNVTMGTPPVAIAHNPRGRAGMNGVYLTDVAMMDLGFVAATFTKGAWRNGDSTREYVYKLDGTELTP